MKEIKKLASGQLARNWKFLKLAYGGGRRFFGQKGEDLKNRVSGSLAPELHKIVNELGLMKGPVMKVGQMLSLYSEAFFPKELQALLAQLENTSFYLSWEEIQKNIPPELHNKLEIETTPFAAASLGQVHRAQIKETGETLALKVQYKGVEKAIDNDVKALKMILKIADLLPRDHDISYVFEEVKTMLHQETDYHQELKAIQRYREELKDQSDYYVPRVYEEFSSPKVLALEYVEGHSLRELEELNISQEQRDRLGENFLRLFFRELFEWGFMQTDPHPGNYLIQKAENPNETPRLVLLDFGACKELKKDLQDKYQEFVLSVTKQDFEHFLETLINYGFLDPNKEFNRELLKSHFHIISSPFTEEVYDWGNSTIPDEVLKIAPKFMKEISVYKPPKDIIFIDRKIGGVFFILKRIRAKFSPNVIAREFIDIE